MNVEATNEIGTNPAGAQSRGAEGGTNLSVGLAAMTLEEVTERMLAMEGAVQRIMAIVAMALPHTDAALSAMNAEWGRIISDIERDHLKAANVKLRGRAFAQSGLNVGLEHRGMK